MSGRRFTLHRVFAMLGKEFIQMRRDKTTLAMLLGIPLMQLFSHNRDFRRLFVVDQLFLIVFEAD